MVVVQPSPRRIQAILNHLEITFTNCRFIYSEMDAIGKPPRTHTPEEPRNGHGHDHEPARPPPAAALGRRRSTLASIQKWVQDTTSDILNHNPLGALDCGRKNEAFIDCIFPPGEEADVRDQVEAYETEHCKFTFNHCIFVKRELAWWEELIRKFKRMLGIRFELDFVSGAATVVDKKCKLKDIPWIVETVTVQIEEDQPKPAASHAAAAAVQTNS